MVLDQRFEDRKKMRYYRILLSQDLFGDWVVTRVWGGIGKASGRIKHSPCSSYEDAITFIRNIAKIRIRRGYQLQEPFHQTQ